MLFLCNKARFSLGSALFLTLKLVERDDTDLNTELVDWRADIPNSNQTLTNSQQRLVSTHW